VRARIPTRAAIPSLIDEQTMLSRKKRKIRPMRTSSAAFPLMLGMTYLPVQSSLGRRDRRRHVLSVAPRATVCS